MVISTTHQREVCVAFYAEQKDPCLVGSPTRVWGLIKSLLSKIHMNDLAHNLNYTRAGT